jgi:hypothetical protein
VFTPAPRAARCGGSTGYGAGPGGAYQYAHGYSFSVTSTLGGSYAVTVYDRAGNDAEVGFAVTRDPSLCSGRGITAPVVSLAATAEGTGVALAWSASDVGSGLAGCELVYREAAGAGQPYAACV